MKICTMQSSLPATKVSNEDLEKERPDWDMKKVSTKTGVVSRSIAKNDETSFDLAKIGIQKLIDSGQLDCQKIDCLIVCTQTPDYLMPSNSFLLHSEFNFREDILVYDYNLACSGFVFGLIMIDSFFKAGYCNSALLVTGDTYSKLIDPDDRSTRSLFGDGVVVSLIEKGSDVQGILGVATGASGKDGQSFWVPEGGFRHPAAAGNPLGVIEMDGMRVWKFIVKQVPKQIRTLLEENDLEFDDIDWFIFHQASKLTLDGLVSKLKIPEEKVLYNYDKIGNTVSASIPFVLEQSLRDDVFKPGQVVLISGFGVGLSWASVLFKF